MRGIEPYAHWFNHYICPVCGQAMPGRWLTCKDIDRWYHSTGKTFAETGCAEQLEIINGELFMKHEMYVNAGDSVKFTNVGRYNVNVAPVERKLRDVEPGSTVHKPGFPLQKYKVFGSSWHYSTLVLCSDPSLGQFYKDPGTLVIVITEGS